MIKSNVSLVSNVYILQEELDNDIKFHEQVRGRKALHYLYNYINKQRHTNEAGHSMELSPLQKAEARVGWSCDNNEEGSWGVIKKGDTFFVECRCEKTECPQYTYCTSLTNQQTLSELQYEVAEISELIADNASQLYEDIAIDDKFDNKMLMTYLVALERINSDISHLRDITDRLARDVNELKEAVMERLST